MLSVDLPVSLKVSLRLSPFNRLMPLKDASCAVVVICAMMLLYWLTRLERIACEAASATGTPTAPKVAGTAPAPVKVTAPMVDEAASLVVVMMRWLALSRLADRLLAAKAVFSWASDSLAPKVMLVAVPPPVAAMARVSPLLMLEPSTRFADVPARTDEVVVDLVV